MLLLYLLMNVKVWGRSAVEVSALKLLAHFHHQNQYAAVILCNSLI
jgi:hypothetical protein